MNIPLGTYPTVLLVGRTKVGKSAAVIRALGAKCFYLCCERGAITPALQPRFNPTLTSATPWRPERGRDYVECLRVTDPCGEVDRVLASLIAKKLLGTRYAAICLDTVSELADRHLAWLKAMGPAEITGGRKWAYGEPWTLIYDRLKGIIRRAMAQNCMVIGLAHERPPSDFDGKFTPGGALVPGKLVEGMPSLFDIVARIGIDGGKPVLRCNSYDTDYVTGDRFGVVVDGEPLDLKSVLRRALLAARGRWEEAEALRPKVGAAEAVAVEP